MSDVAELNSIQTQLDELQQRVAGMANRYRDHADDVAAATDLFNAERALLQAARSVERAASALTAYAKTAAR